MTRARQPALALGRRGAKTPAKPGVFVPAGRDSADAIEDFDFAAHPDPKTTPRPEWVIPAALRLPTDPEAVE
jgi:hypothetical protein